MKLNTKHRRTLTVAGLGIVLAVTPGAAFASTSASASPSAATTTTVAAPTTTTKATTTAPTTAPTTKTYEVIAGTFKTKASADKRLAAITAKSITGLTVVKIGKTAKTTRYRVEQTGLTKTDAKSKEKAIKAAGFHARYVAH